MSSADNSLDPDLARQNVGSDLDPKCLTFFMVFLKYLFLKVYFEKKKAEVDNNECKE